MSEWGTGQLDMKQSLCCVKLNSHGGKAVAYGTVLSQSAAGVRFTENCVTISGSMDHDRQPERVNELVHP